MKKLLLTLCLMTLSLGSASAETINAIWSFNIANTQGTYFRAIMTESNRLQSRYQFVADSKPGAGGQIAASYVAEQKPVTLLGTTFAFFIRPNLYQVPYSFDQFRLLHVMTVAPPALVTKNKTLDQILSQSTITIGTAGPGTGTHLNALKFKESLPNKNIIVVPYKSSTEALKDVMGGHVDLTFEFLADAEGLGARILGVAGNKKVGKYPLLKDMGYANQADMVNSYFILVKNDINEEQYQEMQRLFIRAEQAEHIQALYRKDYSYKPDGLSTPAGYRAWYHQNIKFWKDATKGMRIE
ncbi:Bordetella uptake gene [uncultured Caudovirales phage]|uniref:Bordetella uptake protein n=1 Tax=uncultured Caudovirales phage TaxID=2100421 RepID=A0A6J5M1T7_9CAUD|nr:Bordetella uptake gene [uncultured Caudovirales phage]